MELYTDKLKAVRKRKKITGAELAKKIGVTRVTLGAWENKKRIPSEAKIRMLAKALNISINEISDIPADKGISDINLTPLSSSIKSLLRADEERNANRQKNLVSGITALIKEISDARLIINAILSSLPTIFYVKGLDLKYIAVSDSFLENLSLQQNYEVSGKTDSDFFPQSEAKINNDTDEEVLVSGNSISGKEGFIPGTRKRKWGIFSKSPILDSEGKVEGILGCFVDITERKNAEEEVHDYQIKLKLQNEELHIHQIELEMQNNELRMTHTELEAAIKRYFDLYDLAPIGFFTLNSNGIIIETNLTASRILGVDRDKLIKEPFTRFICSEDKDNYFARQSELLKTGKHQEWDMRLKSKDGSVLWVYIQTCLNQNGDCMLAVNDITTRKNLETIKA